MNAQQVGRKIGVRERTLRTMVRSGEFPQPIRRNRRWVRWPAEVVEAYFQRLAAQTTHQPTGDA